ncbi:hypothetical protein ANANG_G00174230 [Anguilla anguilla]|uniref:Uncharacterized protein n=1 Tax=Anguilla anguilla TaxID=7936 RepID=A0A9D3RSU7_ANGAN|nr:hypothetical protein ANANG_G00174230 [Anguilla anguilla]
MSTVSSIHTQLASIVDVLAKAAVAEICELVDNGYAILHLEISRSHKENKALKKKLQMMELRIARRSDDRIARANSANSCSDRVQICNELRQNKPRKDEYYPSNVWGNRECRAPDEDGTTLSSTRDQSADKKRVRPESRLVKMEQLEEDFESSEQRGGVNINEQKIVESDGGEKAPIADAQTEPAIGTEELTEQHSTRKTVWEDSTLEMSRSQKEVEALKRKLSMQTMELRIAKEARFPSTEIALNSQLDISPWRDGMPNAVDNDIHVQSTSSNGSKDTVEVRPQSVHIKKETIDDDLENNRQGALRIRQERAMEGDSSKRTPTADTETEPAMGTEERSEQHSTRNSVWEDNEHFNRRSSLLLCHC